MNVPCSENSDMEEKMETNEVFYCPKCMELKSADDFGCALCGSSHRVLSSDRTDRTDDRPRLQVTSRYLINPIGLNGNETMNKIVAKLQQLSTKAQSNGAKMKFCFVCGVEKQPEHNFCSSRNCKSARLITPKSDRERLTAMAIVLRDGSLESIDSCETLKTVRTIIDPLIPEQTAITQPG